ncbi:hypothetical protein RKD18_007866 [Streptomyces phaeoluteigriseus]
MRPTRAAVTAAAPITLHSALFTLTNAHAAGPEDIPPSCLWTTP